MEDAAATPRFMVDHMVLRLGKYLRIIGCDAAWDRTADTRTLIHRANREHRILLTRNRRLADQFPLPEQHFLIRPDDPVQQFLEVVHLFGLNPREHLFTRCLACNSLLESVPQNDPRLRAVPPRIVARHRQFYRCPKCAQTFWKGTHVRNTLHHLGLTAPPETGPAYDLDRDQDGDPL